IVVIKRLDQEHSLRGFEEVRFDIIVDLFRYSYSINFFYFFLSRHEQAVESSAKVVGAGNAFGALVLSVRGDGADFSGAEIHSAERLDIGESQLERDGLTGIKLKRVIRGYLGSHLLWIDRRFVAANHIFVEGVFHVR